MPEAVNNIVVVGGGSSGWLIADRLAKKFNCQAGGGVNVTLIESPDINPISVGEGTFPTILHTLATLGVPEDFFIKECDATFKQSIKFVDWLHTPTNGKSHYYHHLFNKPRPCAGGDLTPYWLLHRAKLDRFDLCVSEQSHMCDIGLAPKFITSPQYQGYANYAFHMDAIKFVHVLRQWGIEKLGVNHIPGHVEKVNLSEDGFINSVDVRQHGTVSGDLFIDCTGFSSYLIGKTLGVPFVDRSDTLYVDRAIAMQVPYESADDPIACSTIATAKTAGWIWDIGLQSRRGIGYVYSSAHESDNTAEATLRNYVGSCGDDLAVNKFKFRVGHREKIWHKNCVAVGFSGFFVEPLEATAIALVEAAALFLCDMFPHTKSSMPLIEKKYNNSMRYRFDKIFDFIKMHYYLSKRDDSDFWRDNRDPGSLSHSLRANLEQWKYQMPGMNDFRDIYETFTASSYQWIMYGMEFNTDLTLSQSAFPFTKQIEREFIALQQIVSSDIRRLPSHRELINKIREYGIPRV